MHRNEDITTTDKLFLQQQLAPEKLYSSRLTYIDIDLGDGRPIAVLLDALPQLWVLQHVVCRKFLWINALQSKHLDGRSREAALRRLWRTLHEHDNGVRSDGLVDSGLGLFGEAAAGRL